MNPEKEQTNSKVTNLDDEISIENQKGINYTDENNGNNKLNEKAKDIEDEYKFGWSSYSEITNGRFAMIGFLAICLLYTSPSPRDTMSSRMPSSA